VNTSELVFYEVGGAVRDELLGIPVQDRDYVVVGATPEKMTALGFKPVGKDFPVFLHPQTREEYALARTERKSGHGYKGFKFHAGEGVTLEEDLQRRDLTINAMARNQDGEIIDPYGGQADLQAGLLRHVSDAFAEDPVRILRVARFAARFENFTVAPETLALMQQMASGGEVDYLVPERVWQELSRGLMEKRPSRMFQVLRECGALKKILPEVDHLFGVPQRPEFHPEVDTGIHVMLVVDWAASQGYALPVRFAALTHDLGKGTTPAAEWPKHHGHETRSVSLLKTLCERLRVPAECRDLALLVARYHGDVHRALELRPDTILRILESTDAFRRPERFDEFLQACEADFRGRPGYEDRSFPPSAYLKGALASAQTVDGAQIAGSNPPDKIGQAIRAARVAVLAEFCRNQKTSPPRPDLE
jgi:tRNA nucleotidyltransferase (CCA-adding enzyme)